jgi:nucleoside-diphosphate-sugar epimerase
MTQDGGLHVTWQGNNFLVTGAGGFIGSHLTETLVEAGAVVRALVHYNASGTAGWLERSPQRSAITLIAGDIRDRDSLLDAFQGDEVIFHLAASSPGVIGKTINPGSGREISMGDLTQMIANLVGKPVKIESDPRRLRPEKSEVERLLADNTPAKASSGWQPRVTLEEGLQHTIDWMTHNSDRHHANSYTI